MPSSSSTTRPPRSTPATSAATSCSESGRARCATSSSTAAWSCAIGASLPALLRAVAGGPVKGDRLKELLEPLAPAFKIIHPVDTVDYGKASCDGKVTVEKGELLAIVSTLEGDIVEK